MPALWQWFGNKLHLVLSCAAIANRRAHFPGTSDYAAMRQRKLMQVATFLGAGMASLQTVGPNDESNFVSARLAGIM